MIAIYQQLNPSKLGRYGLFYVSRSKEVTLKYFDWFVEKFVSNIHLLKKTLRAIGVLSYINHETCIDRVDGVIA